MGLPSYQIFDGLNEVQEKAVKTIDSPLLVVAGPGTGKTLTIVRRIVYLIQQGVRPEDIHAVTFTNRAAREMRERAAAMLGNVAGKVFIGTFHVLGLRIIRECLGDYFFIYSRDEQIELLKSLMKNSAKKAQLAVERISRKRVMRLKKKHQLGQELAKVTHGEKEISRIKGNTFSSHPSLNRETPTTVASAI